MSRVLERRVSERERIGTKGVAVVALYPDETQEDALALHLVQHPEDQNAELTVFVRHFSVRRPQ